MGKLEGKVAVITGSTRSIGRAVAEAYVAEGAKVVVSGRSEEKGQNALDEMNAGENAHFIACDAGKQSEVEALIDGTVEHFGRLDILLGDLQRHVRGDKDLPISGMIDMIAPTYVVDYEGSVYQSRDCLIVYIQDSVLLLKKFAWDEAFQNN